MKKDSSKPIEAQSLKKSFVSSWVDFKGGILSSKKYYNLVGLVLAITGLFLNIESVDPSMLRIQALFLAISIFLITYILILPFKTYISKSHEELYHAFTLIYIYLGGLVVFNLLKFLFASYSIELLYFLKYLGVPLITVLVNITAIYFFKYARKGANFDGELMEWFFLVVLNFHLVIAYTFSDYNLSKTLEKLTEFSYSNTNLLYVFLVYLYCELYGFERIGRIKTSKKIKISLCIGLFLPAILLPYFLHTFVFPNFF